MARTSRPARVVASALVALAIGACGSASGPSLADEPPSVQIGVAEPPVGTLVARAEVAELLAYDEPDASSMSIAAMANPTRIGGPLVFQVVTPFQLPTPEWIEVKLPVRPNGTTGWIRTADVSLSVNPYRIEIDTSDYLLELYEAESLVLSTPIGVGTGDTPTPYGDFYLTELLQPASPDGRYGPFAFGLSGFSDVLTSFRGGEGVIGIHGTDEPDALGTDVSHGCVRVANDVISDMAMTVPLGTPVRIES